MTSRIQRPKKSSKIKDINYHERYSIHSPGKPTFGSILGSGCQPKNPPNVSVHYMYKKKQQQQQEEVKESYYQIGKQNKSKIINNYEIIDRDLLSILDTAERFRQKRNTLNAMPYDKNNFKPLVPKKHLWQPHANINQTTKITNKNKNTSRPLITLGSMKSKHAKNIDKQIKPQHNEKQIRRQSKNKMNRTRYHAEEGECQLKCFQNLGANSLGQTKILGNFSYDLNTNSLSFEESYMIIEKQKKNQNNKTFHHSPKLLSPTTIKLPQRTPEDQLSFFQSKIQQININFQHDSLSIMRTKDIQFVNCKNLNCYLSNQLNLDWKKRAMVINWMIEVLAQTGGKRQTFANGVNIFDRYLSMTENIPLDYVQCIAVSCLLLSAKLQDKSLNATYLSQATLGKYSPQTIMEEEFKIFACLNFKVNTPTLNSWGNRLAVQWDIYLDNIDLRCFNIILGNLHSIKFKTSDQTSYYNFRWLCQYIDFAIMDICTLRYQPRMLSLAFIYLILVMRLNLYTKQKVIGLFPNSSQFLLEQNPFHEFFSMFLRDSFNITLKQLLPNIQYCATFVALPLKFDLPETMNEDPESGEQINYENFCSYQTKNQHTLSALYGRNRNVF